MSQDVSAEIVQTTIDVWGCPVNPQERERIFDDLYKAHRPAVLKYIKSLTGSATVAEDIAQDVFHDLLNSPKPIPNVRPWLYAVAHNKSIDYRRRLTPIRAAMAMGGSLDADPDRISATSAIAVVFGLNKDDLAIMFQQIHDQLERPQDRKLLLLLLEDRKYDDIADVLGIRPGNLRARVHHLISRIRGLLAKRTR